MKFSRRHFLKTSLFSSLALPVAVSNSKFPDVVLESSYPNSMGYVAGADYVRVFEEPSPNSRQIDTFYYGQSSRIVRPAEYNGEPYSDAAPSRKWYLTPSGCVHSSYFVCCFPRTNEVIESIPYGYSGNRRMLGMVTVPTGWRHREPDPYSQPPLPWPYRIFYGQTYWLIDIAQDQFGHAWYRIMDDYEPSLVSWVRASLIWPVQGYGISLSPGAEKRIVIDRDQQQICCFENDALIADWPCRTGGILRMEDGSLQDYTTPRGTYYIEGKAPSRRMVGLNGGSVLYDLAGVPFTQYFISSGVAIHGAYWHDNFGVAGSHGCVNVSLPCAYWLFRWTEPYCPPGLFYLNNPDPTRGTRVEVI